MWEPPSAGGREGGGLLFLNKQQPGLIDHKGHHPCHNQLECGYKNGPWPAAGFFMYRSQRSCTWYIQQAEYHQAEGVEGTKTDLLQYAGKAFHEIGRAHV